MMRSEQDVFFARSAVMTCEYLKLSVTFLSLIASKFIITACFDCLSTSFIKTGFEKLNILFFKERKFVFHSPLEKNLSSKPELSDIYKMLYLLCFLPSERSSIFIIDTLKGNKWVIYWPTPFPTWTTYNKPRKCARKLI